MSGGDYMTKQIVCKGCGTVFLAKDEKGKDACPICIGISPDSGIAVEVELPDQLTCDMCKKSRSTEDLLVQWGKIPFLNPARGQYYCGCRGWD